MQQPPEALLSQNPFYRYLYQMASEEPLQHVLEIGSATGDGSTEVLYQALSQRPDAKQVQLYCLESQPERFAALSQRFADVDWVHCFPYLAVYPVTYPTPAELQRFNQETPTALQRIPFNQVLDWLAGETAMYEASAHRLHGVAAIQQQFGIETFDMVVLDAGEFSGPADLEPVLGARILVLDDINSFKNYANFQILQAHRDYYLIQQDWLWRNGCAVFKRRPAHLKPGLAAVVHTRNAASKLTPCLDSLDWVDELIVIDMYSEDQTVALATAQGARVLRHVPVDCVDEARNFGLSQVEHEWTLVLDADERIPADWVSVLQALLADVPPQISGFWLPRNNLFFGQHLPFVFPDYQLRLFRSQAVSWRGVVHEHPKLLSGEAIEVPGDPVQAIQHEAYDQVSDFMQRQLHYAQILWKQYKRHLPMQDPVSSLGLRQRYEQQMAELLRMIQQRPLDNLEWLVRHLYLFSELANTAVFLEQMGELRGASNLQDRPRLSAYSYLRNGLCFDYPFQESLISVLTVCDEVLVTCARDSEDQSWEALQALALRYPTLRLVQTDVWLTPNLRDGEVIRLAAEEAMALCEGDWLWHVQADEVYTDQDARQVRDLVQTYHYQDLHGFIFQVLHFYADYDTVLGPESAQAGWYPQCIRLTRKGYGRHIGDAWTQVLTEASESSALPVNVRIFHYGHVRETEKKALKEHYMHQLYTADGSVPSHFVNQRVNPAHLKRYTQAHPESMQERIAQARLQPLLEAQVKRPRILVISRYPQIKKGYGITFNEIYQTGVLQSVFEMHHLAWHYHEPESVDNGVHFYPDHPKKPRDPLRLRELLYRLKPDNILLHADLHFFLRYIKELQLWQGPVTGWFTVDYERNRNPAPLFPIIQRCQRILGLADFGLNQIKKDYQGPLSKVPLGVNHRDFFPVDKATQQRLRTQLGLPTDAFLLVLVANNFWRKGLEYAILAMAYFNQRYPELAKSTYLYMHTEANDLILEQISSLGLQNQVFVSKQFDPYKNPLSVTQLSRLYQASDAFFLTTLGEGFGMPLLEAQACGLPIIVSDNSVIREVAGDAALYIRCPGWISGQNADRVVWMHSPDPEHAAEQIYYLRQNPQVQAELRQAGLRQSRSRTWEQTSRLLAAELAQALGTGTLEYHLPEPGLIKV